MSGEEESTDSVPGWIVTYGDLMSLLLTFFVLLASMSEIRENDKYQGVADSMHEHFGRVAMPDSLEPGEARPRNALFAALTLAGRSKRKQLLEERGTIVAKNDGSPKIRVVRPGSQTAVGVVVYFTEKSAELDLEAREDLLETAELLRGKPQKIEVRGHASQEPSESDEGGWELAVRRAENTMKFLIDDLQIEPKRIRMSVAGSYEPASTAAGEAAQRANSRVEVFLLDEVVSESLTDPQTAANPTTDRF